MNELIKILGDPSEFLKNVFSSLENENLNVSDFELDHICYRVETIEKYNALKTKISKIAENLGETIINGRPIITFKLSNPIKYENIEIWCVELPSPKKEVKYNEGYEHVEFVINITFDELINQNPNINFKTKDLNKKINPDISIKFENFSVKFHENSLEYVIKYLQ